VKAWAVFALGVTVLAAFATLWYLLRPEPSETSWRDDEIPEGV
jgi:hypothetical protein